MSLSNRVLLIFWVQYGAECQTGSEELSVDKSTANFIGRSRKISTFRGDRVCSGCWVLAAAFFNNPCLMTQLIMTLCWLLTNFHLPLLNRACLEVWWCGFHLYGHVSHPPFCFFDELTWHFCLPGAREFPGSRLCTSSMRSRWCCLIWMPAILEVSWSRNSVSVF